MEIAPIAGIRLMPAIKVRPVDSELTPFFAIEPSSRPGDDTYSNCGRKAAGAEESDDENEELEEEAFEEMADAAPAPPGMISIFA